MSVCVCLELIAIDDNRNDEGVSRAFVNKTFAPCYAYISKHRHDVMS